VYDVREQKMPDIGMVSMLDAETGETQLILVQNSSIHEKHYNERLNYFKKHSVSQVRVVNTRLMKVM
jgi:hypothetical protein